jgi:hypothetical protein
MSRFSSTAERAVSMPAAMRRTTSSIAGLSPAADLGAEFRLSRIDARFLHPHGSDEGPNRVGQIRNADVKYWPLPRRASNHFRRSL